jgi:hypothetical protein
VIHVVAAGSVADFPFGASSVKLDCLQRRLALAAISRTFW